MIHVFKSTIIEKQLTLKELNNLEDDFRLYKETGELPDTFGRDARYDHPNTLPSILQEEISHLHLTSGEKPWPTYKIQFQRTSDTHLIYCPGSMDDNCFLLMAILRPNAHELARSRDVMWKLANMAEIFRNKY